MIALDAYDRKILEILQRNARITNQELAQRVNLSPAPCWRRVKRLEEAGVIRRYVALLDPAAVGIPECVYVQVSLQTHSEDFVAAFQDVVLRSPEVLECVAATGDADYFLKVVASGIASYDRFLSRRLICLPGIAHVKSSFRLRQIKEETALPLAPADDSDA